jgi:hypothetical protein
MDKKEDLHDRLNESVKQRFDVTRFVRDSHSRWGNSRGQQEVSELRPACYCALSQKGYK